jgi:hypothetical protein
MVHGTGVDRVTVLILTAPGTDCAPLDRLLTALVVAGRDRSRTTEMSVIDVRAGKLSEVKAERRSSIRQPSKTHCAA